MFDFGRLISRVLNVQLLRLLRRQASGEVKALRFDPCTSFEGLEVVGSFVCFSPLLFLSLLLA